MGRRRKLRQCELQPLPAGRTVEGPHQNDSDNIRFWVTAIQSEDRVIDALEGIRLMKRWLDEQEYRWVFEARRREIAWLIIAMHLGPSRQAVWARWADRTP